MNSFMIKDFLLGSNNPPFIIAEMSGNHNQSLERAKEIVRVAASTGAHAIKLQTYTPDTMTINHRGGLFDITDKKSLWLGRNLYELYKEAHTPWEWHKPLFDYAAELGLICFSTPFDDTAVDFLETLNVPCYKIASFENTDHPLLKKVAKTGKPVIMSTGIANLSDIMESVQVLKENGSKEIVLLKCTSTYPATPENTNLVTIPVLQQVFQDCIIGLSDHTMGIGASIASIALGARVIEKHFTISRADGGVDSTFSMEPAEMKSLVLESERAFLALGQVQLNVQKAEEKSRVFKRSIYVVADVKKGDILSSQNLRVIRPGDGLAPKYFESILGKHFKIDLKTGTPMSMDYLT
ncbi:MAG: pseudaminic acid synthase [Cytophagales bacterium]|jgi:pseudaminic acid synthase|nr:pseudaminic acid synthase [Cytophagales bacterium]MCA6388889.1 pseudaminic acid synthase [Cytophagales bacterium]MCA6391119.1 pseudaminic acid synthase [Cytophagales bacterium]MCA6397736.1 pseudaminic acid synthase [Cytophagales bacterium]MCA6401429.1 pseudaminic acid synthase [Cytophagales bacterium]